MYSISVCQTESAAAYGRFLYNEFRDGLSSFEDAAQTCAEAIYDEFRGDDGQRAFSLIRMFRMTHYDDLPADLAPLATDESDYWLALAGTIGDETEWCDRRLSHTHRLISPHSSSTMFQAVQQQMGLTWGDHRVEGKELVSQQQAWTTRSFFVPDALSSPLIPDQDFVYDYNIRSVIGLGGIFASGNSALFVAFANAPISAECQQNFAEITPFLMTLLAGYDERGAIWRD